MSDESKLKIRISKKMHLQIADFNNVQVEIDLELSDIKLDEFNKKYTVLSKLTDACLVNDLCGVLSEGECAVENIKAYGLGINENREKIQSTIKTLTEYLKN